MVEILCINTQTFHPIHKGASLAEILKKIPLEFPYPVVGALVNNKLRELDFEVYRNKQIEFIDVRHPVARRMYMRSASFVLYKAVRDLFPKADLHIEHAVPGGYYCEIHNVPFEINDQMALAIESRVAEIIKEKLPFRREQLPSEEALKLFERHGLTDKLELVRNRQDIFTSVYYLADEINYYYGYLLPSTDYLYPFEFDFFENGFIMRLRDPEAETYPKVERHSKLFRVFREHKDWLDILGLNYVGDLNAAIAKPEHGQLSASNLVQIGEALHEKRIAYIADEVGKRKSCRMVLISGPSSSGKTTFSKRLAVQLQVNGLDPQVLALDNYFVDREHTPKDDDGNYDFECLEAIDLPFFNQQLLALLKGESVEIPSFNFITGQREFNGQTLQLQPKSILVIEGIHGLNPKLTAEISNEQKYKIFVSALTHIAIDAQNPIPTTDNRLLRRIVRDYRYRGYSAVDTIQRWPSVRRGEELHIFPFQEQADVFFNSALLFELAVLKTYAEPILRAVPENCHAYNDATHLLKFLSYFAPMSERAIPPTSVMREFLGGSSFIY